MTKLLIIIFFICVSCSENKSENLSETPQSKIEENLDDEITDVYYKVSSNNDINDNQYYLISTSSFVISDSTENNYLTLTLNKKVIPAKDSIDYFISFLRIEYTDFIPSDRLILIQKSLVRDHFHLYGFVDGIETIIDGDVNSEYQRLRDGDTPIYLGYYNLFLERLDVNSLQHLENIVLSYKTGRKTNIGTKEVIEIPIDCTVLDTMKLMINDNWKDQLERLKKRE